MRVFAICAAAALAMGCTPAEEAENMAPGCDARAAHTWNAADQTLSVEAFSNGPGCDRAVATLIIRDASGAPLYAETHFAGQVMTLAGAADQAAMQTALGEWADPAGATTMQTTAALPEWPASAEAPSNGEFPFYPDDEVDRAAYASLREQNAPLFCYVQGMESMRCVAWIDNSIASVGLQLFPG